MKIKLISLNNKSRKGEYVYIKDKGANGAYFKIKTEEEPIDIFVKYYLDRYVS